MRGLVARLRPLLLKLRALAAPLLLPRQQKEFLRILAEVKPDLVHALRVPFEGMLAAAAPAGIPLIVSIWGNDLTFHARTSFLMKRQTRRTLARADGLLADASRDVRLALQWGLRCGCPHGCAARQWRIGYGRDQPHAQPEHPARLRPARGTPAGGQPARLPPRQRTSGCVLCQPAADHKRISKGLFRVHGHAGPTPGA